MDKVNIYEWKTQVVSYTSSDESNRIMYKLLRELYDCGFTDVQWLGGNSIYATGTESNWADLILTNPDLYDLLAKPQRIYYDDTK